MLAARNPQRGPWPNILIQVGEGEKALIKESGSSRLAAVQKAAQSVGGKVEGFYFACGDADAYIIVDLPDAAAAAALALTVNASGTAATNTRCG